MVIVGSWQDHIFQSDNMINLSGQNATLTVKLEDGGELIIPCIVSVREIEESHNHYSYWGNQVILKLDNTQSRVLLLQRKPLQLYQYQKIVLIIGLILSMGFVLIAKRGNKVMPIGSPFSEECVMGKCWACFDPTCYCGCHESHPDNPYNKSKILRIGPTSLPKRTSTAAVWSEVKIDEEIEKRI